MARNLLAKGFALRLAVHRSRATLHELLEAQEQLDQVRILPH